jgi:hypothetical protein
MPRLRSKSDNSSMEPGGFITRINSLRNILRQSFAIRFGPLNITGTSRALPLNNGFIGLLLHRRKVLRRKNHKEHEFGFSKGDINLWVTR